MLGLRINFTIISLNNYMQTEKFNRAIQEFDKANRADPNEVVWQGTSYPKELLYGQQMTACLNDFIWRILPPIIRKKK